MKEKEIQVKRAALKYLKLSKLVKLLLLTRKKQKSIQMMISVLVF